MKDIKSKSLVVSDTINIPQLSIASLNLEKMATSGIE
jgi:hypothetical protein